MRRIALATAAVLLIALTGASAGPPAKPRLLVLVVFDQLRGDYLGRWGDLFGAGGFRRLTDEGTWFTDCHYPYASTMTACGHASLLTGCSPDRHGIIGNEWYDRAEGKEVSGVGDDRAQPVTSVEPTKGTKKAAKGSSSARLLAETVGDVLKAADPRSQVVALAIKDRSACLPGGKRPDACYWLDTRTGTFMTSTHYAERVDAWVARFNAGRPADRWLGKAWDRLRPDVDYTARSGPDDVASEGGGLGNKLGRTFPHVLSPGKAAADQAYYTEVTGTPFGNELLLDFARSALREMNLGRGPATDLLSVSFSSNDLVGHPFGPDSQEVLDITLRSDRAVAGLLDELDRTVGRGQYLVALSSDHGICPIPELSAARGLDAVRLHPKQLRKSVEEFLDGKFGSSGESSQWLEGDAFPWLYLNQRKLESRGLKPDDVAGSLAAWLRVQPWASAAFTRRDLAAVPVPGDAVGARMKTAFHADRSGDVGLVLKSYYLSTEYATGTTHGSPHSYDTHVPLVFYGPGILPGKCADAVTPQAVAAVFARAAGVRPPAQCDTPVPARCAAAAGGN